MIRRSAAGYGVFASDHHDAFSYDDHNDLTQSKRYNNTSPGTTSNPDTAYDRVFTYDTYGSRDTYKLGTDPTTDYSTDNRNLYDSTEDPNEPFTYDYDHNLTEDGSFEYTYDAENRLIRVEPAEDDPNQLTADDKKIEYEYDYLSRRVRKAVYAWDPNAADWSATAELDLRFVYHERKLLLELDGLDSLAKVRKYVWGPGPGSAGVSPVGRVGALDRLLAIGDVSGSTDYVCFTNAQGSVVQLLDRSDGSIDAKYVYDVNGDTVSKSGTYADDNPLRFRAMYFDKELDYADTACDGLYCSPTGNCYSPRLGRALEDYSDSVYARPTIVMGNCGGDEPSSILMSTLRDLLVRGSTLMDEATIDYVVLSSVPGSAATCKCFGIGTKTTNCTDEMCDQGDSCGSGTKYCRWTAPSPAGALMIPASRQDLLTIAPRQSVRPPVPLFPPQSMEIVKGTCENLESPPSEFEYCLDGLTSDECIENADDLIDSYALTAGGANMCENNDCGGHCSRRISYGSSTHVSWDGSMCCIHYKDVSSDGHCACIDFGGTSHPIGSEPL